MMPAMADTLHHLPGRLRLRLAALRRNPDLAARLRSSLAALPGLAGVDVNPLTGSVLVHYDPAAGSLAGLAAALAAHGIAMPDLPPLHPAERLGEAMLALAVEAVLRKSAAALLGALV